MEYWVLATRWYSLFIRGKKGLVRKKRKLMKTAERKIKQQE